MGSSSKYRAENRVGGGVTGGGVSGSWIDLMSGSYFSSSVLRGVSSRMRSWGGINAG